MYVHASNDFFEFYFVLRLQEKTPKFLVFHLYMLNTYMILKHIGHWEDRISFQIYLKFEVQK